MFNRALCYALPPVQRVALRQLTTHSAQVAHKRPALSLERSRAPKTQTTYKQPFTQRKQYLFSEYDKQFSTSPATLVLQHHNLSGAEQLELRNQLKFQAQGAKLMVVRPKMFKAVLRHTRFANMENLFSGPSAIVYWNSADVDGIQAMGQVLEIVRPQRKLIVMGAKYGDSLVLNPSMLGDFVKLPDIDQLRSQVVGIIGNPARALASVLNRIPQRLVGVLKQRADGEGQEKQ
ncbi:hypothetical protein LPJ59_000602 [Coemansia sp. RSA 2399]|nr:hypothetical protein LPJ59_000602 [Coemansia sp. RSA 2399]KAJ1908366.1 hypothetical protein LPJ81_000157 [Coemansia sp. IMI 209127]